MLENYFTTSWSINRISDVIKESSYNCLKCGNQLFHGAKTCKKCGSNVYLN